jgi:methylglutamate dehydrogenase subunit B
MLIPCPFCGPRESGEFSYLGDARPKRPDVDPDEADAEAAREAFHEYVYLRDNIAGEMCEYWYHGGGCRAWLIVVRNTLTHQFTSVSPAPGAGQGLKTGRG